MSIKSLLQLILILIFIIIAGIYFIFLFRILKSEILINKDLDKLAKNKIYKDGVDQEILEDLIISKEVNNESDLNDKNINKNKNAKIKNENIVKNESNKIKNLTKEIEYITSNNEGDIFKILAKYGKTNIENTNILDLEKVDGVISSTKRSQIYITSDYAKYNYNQNHNFLEMLNKYDNKIITCDNLDLQINQNCYRLQ